MSVSSPTPAPDEPGDATLPRIMTFADPDPSPRPPQTSSNDRRSTGSDGSPQPGRGRRDQLLHPSPVGAPTLGQSGLGDRSAASTPDAGALVRSRDPGSRAAGHSHAGRSRRRHRRSDRSARGGLVAGMVLVLGAVGHARGRRHVRAAGGRRLPRSRWQPDRPSRPASADHVASDPDRRQPDGGVRDHPGGAGGQPGRRDDHRRGPPRTGSTIPSGSPPRASARGSSTTPTVSC